MTDTKRDELGKLLPLPLSMREIVQPMQVWAVRMKRFDRQENTVFGSMVWPEVLVCATHDEAESLRKFLDDASFQDYMESIQELEPAAETHNHKMHWRETDIAQYAIEMVPNLREYAEIERIGESMSVMARLFPTLEGVAALRRHRR